MHNKQATGVRLGPRHLWCCLLAAVFISCQAWAGLLTKPVDVPVGKQAAQPSITPDRNGGFVLTWQEKSGEAVSLQFAHLDDTGQILRRGLIARKAADQEWFVNWADFPSLAVLDNGDWVSFWLQKSAAAVYAYDVWLTRSTDQGQTWSPPLLLNRDGTATEHGFVTLLPAGEDRVLVLWLDGRRTAEPGADDTKPHSTAGGKHSGAMTLRSAVVDGSNTIQWETEIDNSTCDCCNTDAVRSGDNIMAIYRDRSDSEVRDIRFSVGDGAGDWSEPQLVYRDQWEIAACPVNGPALAANGNELLAVWTTMQDENLLVRAALGTMAGFGPMQEVEAGGQVLGRVDAAPWGERDFLLSWLGQSGLKSPASSVKLARMAPGGSLRDEVVVADLPPGRNIGFPRLASSGQTALLAWTEPTADGSTIRVLRISQ